MKNKIMDIYGLLQELAWQFGNSGPDDQCCENLSLVEFIALKKIHEWQGPGKPSIQAIGNALHFTKSGATRIVDRLEVKDYARRELSSEDGRVCCISITSKGEKTLAGIISQKTEHLKESLAGLDSARVEDIRKTLQLLMQAIGKKDQ